jgi:Na+/proline symporter
MIVISAVFVPVYHRLKVRTAYEYLEHRFDVRVRFLGGLLFLLGRGLAAGITIYAPSIILSQILGWPLQPTIFVVGGVVIVYTVLGGTQAVSVTQRHQMVVMLTGLAIAAIVIMKLPDDVSVGDAAARGRAAAWTSSASISISDATTSGRGSSAASSSRCRTSAPTSRRSAATSAGAPSPRAGSASCSTAS